MANTTCRSCGADLPAGARTCPECGALQTSNTKVILGATAVVIAGLAIVIGALFLIERDEPANPAGDTHEVSP